MIIQGVPHFLSQAPCAHGGRGRGEKGWSGTSAGANGCGLLGPGSEPREQRKGSEIKTNAVCGNTETWSPCPGQREPPSSSPGAWLWGAGGAPAGGFPPGLPSAGLARVRIARWAAHARVCVCVCVCTRSDPCHHHPNLSLGPRGPGACGRPISAPARRPRGPVSGCRRRISAAAPASLITGVLPPSRLRGQRLRPARWKCRWKL